MLTSSRMAELYRELLEIRYSSQLFRLGTADDIQDRVVFLNTGPNQIPGLIVMALSDLIPGAADLDRNHHQIVVLINATDEAQDFTTGAFQGADLILHPVQMSSVDEVVRTSTFDAATGTFSIPGRTAAVFVEESPPQERIEALIEDVLAIYAEGTLDKGQVIPLLVNLYRARKQVMTGRPAQAINSMTNFVNQVNVYMTEGVLSQETGQMLVDFANAIIDQLNRML